MARFSLKKEVPALIKKLGFISFTELESQFPNHSLEQIHTSVRNFNNEVKEKDKILQEGEQYYVKEASEKLKKSPKPSKDDDTMHLDSDIVQQIVALVADLQDENKKLRACLAEVKSIIDIV